MINWEGVVSCACGVPDFLTVASTRPSSALRSLRVTPGLPFKKSRRRDENTLTWSNLFEWIGVGRVKVVGVHHLSPGVDEGWIEGCCDGGCDAVLDLAEFPSSL
jgi:hypothetical protein